MNIIDIRNNNRYREGHIPNSINIYSYDLLLDPNRYLKKDEKYLLYCQSGVTSKVVVNKLNKMGYNVFNLDGGYNNYLLRK